MKYGNLSFSLDSLNAEVAALNLQLNDGTISKEEYDAQTREISHKRLRLVVASNKLSGYTPKRSGRNRMARKVEEARHQRIKDLNTKLQTEDDITEIELEGPMLPE
jgi:hypothetical protein